MIVHLAKTSVHVYIPHHYGTVLYIYTQYATTRLLLGIVGYALQLVADCLSLYFTDHVKSLSARIVVDCDRQENSIICLF